MALEITVGPPRLAINQGYGVLITDQDGQIRWPTDKGFYHSDTRVISHWRIFADGEPWDLLNSGNIAYYAAASSSPTRQFIPKSARSRNIPSGYRSAVPSAAESTRISIWSITVWARCSSISRSRYAAILPIFSK